mgnify:CR=1 FL=1
MTNINATIPLQRLMSEKEIDKIKQYIKCNNDTSNKYHYDEENDTYEITLDEITRLNPVIQCRMITALMTELYGSVQSPYVCVLQGSKIHIQ